jgi:hypothetical protein
MRTWGGHNAGDHYDYWIKHRYKTLDEVSLLPSEKISYNDSSASVVKTNL